MAMIARPVRRFIDTTPGTELHLIGTDFRPTVGHASARFTHWVKDPADMFGLLDFDIGLAPLTDHPFNHAKSAVKALEYASQGIPVIASDLPPYRDFVTDGVTGFLVSKEKHWLDRLRLLAADADLRETMGRKARELAAQHTIEGNYWRWRDAYQELMR
jgi:glycosyltransferase involved in cell wall biosynthesis